VNLYDYKKKYNAFQVCQPIGFNPDDGIKLGIVQTTLHHFKNHTLKTHLKLIIILQLKV
jgi:hypothetical protein